MWRHDLLATWLKEEDTFSEYFGTSFGAPFNDRALVRGSSSMYISSISIYDESPINSMQVRLHKSKFLDTWTDFYSIICSVEIH